MKLSAAYGPGRFGLSFELFPPKTPQGIASLFQHVARLVEFRPSFITCTYGAGGSTQELTLEIFAPAAAFFRFAERSQARGLRLPSVPGLLPVTNFAQIKRITSLCGAQLPAAFVRRLEEAGDDSDAQFTIGADFATRQTQALVDAGVHQGLRLPG